jgi:hypothetical protein
VPCKVSLQKLNLEEWPQPLGTPNTHDVAIRGAQATGGKWPQCAQGLEGFQPRPGAWGRTRRGRFLTRVPFVEIFKRAESPGSRPASLEARPFNRTGWGRLQGLPPLSPGHPPALVPLEV